MGTRQRSFDPRVTRRHFIEPGPAVVRKCACGAHDLDSATFELIEETEGGHPTHHRRGRCFAVIATNREVSQ